MSSGDAMAHAVGSVVVRDGVMEAAGRRLSPAAQRRWIRWVIVTFVVASYALAVGYRGSLVQLLLSAYGPVVQFAPGVVATLFWRRATGAAVLTGLLAGSAVNLLFVLAPEWRPWPLHAGVYGLLLNAFLLVAIALLTRHRTDPADEAFLAVAAAREVRANAPERDA
jgi:SSS family solute:Na+ symporter